MHILLGLAKEIVSMMRSLSMLPIDQIKLTIIVKIKIHVEILCSVNNPQMHIYIHGEYIIKGASSFY